MTKKLQIKVYDSQNNCIHSIISGHLDSSRNITVLSESEIEGKNVKDIILPLKIDHYSIFEGMITIYYTDGHYLEVTRIYVN